MIFIQKHPQTQCGVTVENHNNNTLKKSKESDKIFEIMYENSLAQKEK